jgi:outer membrane protein assembly factor BamB
MIPNLRAYASRFLARQIKLVFVGCLASIALISCGGGGGGGAGPVTSTLSFPLKSGMAASVPQGGSIDFSVSGTCSGTANITSSTPIPATFGTVTGVSVLSAASMNLPNCIPPYIYGTTTDYYDSNYNPLGTIDSSGNYGVYATPPAIPVSVKVGDTGMIGTINYSDSTQTFPTGHDDISYVIEPDTANTAIVNMIDKSYDLNGNLTSTEQDHYRIKADGTLILVSAGIQAANGSTTHLVLTALPDTVPPAVLTTSPFNYSTTVPAYSTVTATFSEAIDSATLTAASFTLMEVNGTTLTPVSGSVTYSGNTATFTPSTFLTPSTVYMAKITTGVKDLAGNALGSNYLWQFKTSAPDTTPPTVISTSPVNSASAVAIDSAVTATFSELVDPATITTAEFTLMSGTTPVSGSVTYSGTTATFKPSTILAYSTLYTATINTGVEDLAGNSMSINYSWTFTTSAAPFVPNPSPLPPLSQSVAYQNDYAHSGFVTFGTPITFPSSPNWSVTLNGAISYPLIAGGKVFVTTAGVGTGNGTQLYALDQQTGNISWGPVAIVGNSLWSGLAYDHGKVFVINSDGLLKSFDAVTGQSGWSTQLPEYMIDSPPTAVNGIVYVGAQSYGGLYAVNESYGNVLWETYLIGGGNSSPAVSSDGVFVTYPCQAYKFDPLTGASLWHYSGPCEGGGGRTPVYANGLLYMRDWSSNPGLIFDAATGTQTGNFSTTSSTPTPAFSTQTGFFQSAGTLQGIDLSTHNVLWSFAGDGHLVSAPIVIDQVVIVGSSSGTVYALDAATGSQIWSGAAGAAIAGPDEQNLSQPLTGFGAGEGYLIVPAGKVLSAWHISGP